MTEYTDNYGLNKYSDGDAANLRDQYNASMDIIDMQVKTANDNASNATTILNAAGLTDTATAGESKTRWDGAASQAETNKDGIDTINANLKALHADNVSDARALYKQVQTNKTDIAALQSGSIAVFVGDSISQGYGASDNDHRFSTLVAKRLGLTEKNYSRHGAGWTQRSPQADGLTGPQLVQNAVSDDSYNHNDVALVVVEFGINDNNMNNFDGIISSNLIALQNSFPKARYLLLNTLTGGITNSTQYNKPSTGGDASGENMSVFGMGNVISKTNLQAAATKFSVLQAWSWFSMAGVARSIYTTDGLHPNDMGHSQVANYVASAYYGALDAAIFPSVYSYPAMNVSGKINELGNKYYAPLGMYKDNLVSSSDITLSSLAIEVGRETTVIRFGITINHLSFTEIPVGTKYLPLWEMGTLFKKAVFINEDSYNLINNLTTTIMMSHDDDNEVKILPPTQVFLAYDPAYGVISLGYVPTTVQPTDIHGIYRGEITIPTIRNYVYKS